MANEFEQAVTNAPNRLISKLVRTQFGFHIIYFFLVSVADLAAFADAISASFLLRIRPSLNL